MANLDNRFPEQRVFSTILVCALAMSIICCLNSRQSGHSSNSYKLYSKSSPARHEICTYLMLTYVRLQFISLCLYFKVYSTTIPITVITAVSYQATHLGFIYRDLGWKNYKQIVDSIYIVDLRVLSNIKM